MYRNQKILNKITLINNNIKLKKNKIKANNNNMLIIIIIIKQLKFSNNKMNGIKQKA